MNKCRNCEKKSFGWFIWILLHLFGRSKRGLPALSGRSSDVDEDALLVTEQKISTEENANSFITNIAIVFCYWRDLDSFPNSTHGWHILRYEQNQLDRFAVTPTKRCYSWTEFSQAMKNVLFMITFEENNAGNMLVCVQNPWLAANVGVTVRLVGLQRDNSLWASCRRRNNNHKEVLRPTHQS